MSLPLLSGYDSASSSDDDESIDPLQQTTQEPEPPCEKSEPTALVQQLEDQAHDHVQSSQQQTTELRTDTTLPPPALTASRHSTPHEAENTSPQQTQSGQTALAARIADEQHTLPITAAQNQATPNSTADKVTPNKSKQHAASTKKAAHNPSTNSNPSKRQRLDPSLPPELARELARSGHTLADVTFTDVDARAAAGTRTSAPEISANAIAARAGRISKSANISRVARQRHQITALAADAAALQAARKSLGVTTPPARRRR